MSVMHNARTLGKLRERSKAMSWDGVSQGVCERVCWDSEARGGGLGSNRELDMGPEVNREA
jgi:hypothetical protein